MIRQTLISIAFVAFAITTFAPMLPASPTAQDVAPVQMAMNLKSDLISITHTPRLTLEKCAVEDCSDTPQSN